METKSVLPVSFMLLLIVILIALTGRLYDKKIESQRLYPVQHQYSCSSQGLHYMLMDGFADQQVEDECPKIKFTSNSYKVKF